MLVSQLLAEIVETSSWCAFVCTFACKAFSLMIVTQGVSSDAKFWMLFESVRC